MGCNYQPQLVSSPDFWTINSSITASLVEPYWGRYGNPSSACKEVCVPGFRKGGIRQLNWPPRALTHLFYSIFYVGLTFKHSPRLINWDTVKPKSTPQKNGALSCSPRILTGDLSSYTCPDFHIDKVCSRCWKLFSCFRTWLLFLTLTCFGTGKHQTCQRKEMLSAKVISPCLDLRCFHWLGHFGHFFHIQNGRKWET